MQNEQPAYISRLLRGALAGAGATLPMTITMYGLRHLLLPRDTHPLGPNRVMHWSEQKTGLDRYLNRTQHWGLTLISHFGYGAGAGVVYVPFATPRLSQALPRGMAFGLVVWAAGYVGWLPALNIIPSPPHRSPYRRVITLSAHLVWGAALALLLKEEADGRTATQKYPPGSAGGHSDKSRSAQREAHGRDR